METDGASPWCTTRIGLGSGRRLASDPRRFVCSTEFVAVEFEAGRKSWLWIVFAGASDTRAAQGYASTREEAQEMCDLAACEIGWPLE